MSVHFGAHIHSLNEADTILGRRDSYVVGNNTRLRRDGKLATVKLHNTDIVQFRPDGSVLCDTGGWKTSTTKERMNRYLPVGWSVSSEKRIWYVDWRGGGEPSDSGSYFDSLRPRYVVSIPYADGITLWPDGRYRLPAEYSKPAELAAQMDAVKAYARGYVGALAAGEVTPGSGDCFYCQSIVTDMDGNVSSGGGEHVQSHVDESYFVGSLLLRVMGAGGMSQAAMGWCAYYLAITVDDCWVKYDRRAGILHKQVEKAIAKYCARQLGLAS